MNRFILAALALVCACSPALADAAAEPVTWGAVYAILGWAAVGFGALVGVLIILVILFAAIGGFRDWSH